MNPDQTLKPRTQGMEVTVIIIAFIIAVFLRDHFQRSIHDDIIFSKTAITVENAAKAMKIKKQLPQIRPPGIFAKIFGKGCIANFIRKSYERIYYHQKRGRSARRQTACQISEGSPEKLSLQNDAEEEYHAERKKDTGKRAAIRRRCAPAVSGRRNDTKISGGGECRESTGTQSIAPNAAESAKAEAGYHL